MSEEFIRNSLNLCKIKEANHKITYKLSIQVFNQLEVKPWSRQRPVDITRVEEITKSIHENKDIDGMLLMAWHPKEKLIVYDGQHRWKAISQLPKDCSYWVIVEILWNATEEQIYNEFVRVNKSVPVSDLYTSPFVEKEARHDIEEFVKELVEEYRPFVSASRKPQRPNFNRDVVTDELFTLWKDHFSEVEFPSLKRAILDVNTEYHTNPMSTARTAKLSENAKQKCNLYGFWLFAETGRLDPRHLEAKLTR